MGKTDLPTISNGKLEYAYYTSSERGLDGSAGYGFTSVSPVLEDHLQWLALSTRDIVQFVKSAVLSDVERRRYQPVGRKVIGAIAIGYRKSPLAALDAKGRARLYVVEMRIGHCEDLPATWLLSRDPNWWTSAEQFRIDAAMAPPRFGLDGAALNSGSSEWAPPSEQVVRDWVSSLVCGETLRASKTGVEPLSLVNRLVDALPRWCDLRLNIKPSWESSGPELAIDCSTRPTLPAPHIRNKPVLMI